MGFFNEYPYRNLTDLNLDYILKTMGDLKSKVETIVAEWADMTADYATTKRRLAAVENEIATFEQSVTNQFNTLKAQIEQDFADQKAEQAREFNALKRQVEQEISNLENELRYAINEMQMLVNRAIGSMQTAMNANNDYIKGYVANELQKFLDGLPDYETLMVYNPVRGHRTDVQDAINDLYSYALVDSISAGEFDSLHLTAGEFDAMRITATDFDRNAKTIFGVGNPEYMMYSPFTGLLTPIKRIIEQLAALHQNGITAGDFDALQITAGDFDALQISAYNFDWNGVTITP